MDSLSALKCSMLNKRQRGFSLYEVIGALAIGSLMMAGLSLLINNSLDDSQAQQAGLYQSQVANAASKYISDNYNTLLAGASTTTPKVIKLATLTAGESYLASSIGSTNAYSQTPCVYYLKTSGNTLQALVVTEGGNAIKSKDLPYSAANAGQSGGYIKNNAAGQPEAYGAFGSWTLNSAALSPYLPSAANSCTGTAAAADGHLASALFFNGPGTPNNQYVYRNSVTGRQDLNTMSTPLYFSYAGATDGGTDSICNTVNMSAATSSTGASTVGAITTDANGEVLSCQNGKWARQKNTYWKDPVTNYAALLATPGTNIGEVRLVQMDDAGTTAVNRAYSWSGSAWAPLSIDKDGNLSVPGNLTVTNNATVTNTLSAGSATITNTLSASSATLSNRLTANDIFVNSVQTLGSACSPDSLVAKDSIGRLVWCKSGVWRSIIDTSIDPNYTSYEWLKYTADGGGVQYIDLTTFPGTRPLYTSGYAYCNSEDSSSVVGAVEFRDVNKNTIGWAGGCGAASKSGGTGITNSKGFMPLVQIPSNAVWLRVTWALPSSGVAANYTHIWLYIYNTL